jgi:hypothetical protein
MTKMIWHLRGSVALLEPQNVALDRIEGFLNAQYKTKRKRGVDYVTFYDPLWRYMFSPNWLSLGFYDQGRFWIEDSRSNPTLRYDLRSLHGLVFCLLGATIFFGFGALSEGLSRGLIYAALAFGWLYGMNIVLAHLRVPCAIRKALKA